MLPFPLFLEVEFKAVGSVFPLVSQVLGVDAGCWTPGTEELWRGAGVRLRRAWPGSPAPAIPRSFGGREALRKSVGLTN